MMRMTAIISRVWIQLPVCGSLGLMFRPKKPSSQRTSRITAMVKIMSDLLKKYECGCEMILRQTRVMGNRQSGSIHLPHLAEIKIPHPPDAVRVVSK
jgi:hypothetical protein